MDGTKKITMVAMCVAFCSVSAYISFPLPFTPGLVTAVTLAFGVTAFVLPPKETALAICIYLALGAVGIPVLPGGTAGLPMMEVLKSRGVTNCCVVVTRYFGGVLLGAGGLVRAYTKGCAIAVDAARVVRMQRTQKLLLDVPYPLWDRVNHAMKSLPVILGDTAFGASVEATVLVRVRDLADVTQKLAALTDARAEWLELEEIPYPWPEEE